jgi:hypothetical protein
MDLDSLKEDLKQITAPGIDARNAGGGTRPLDDLIAQLKETDEKERKKLRRALPFWIIAAVIFCITFVFTFIPGGFVLNSSLIMRGMLMVLYVCIAAVIGIKVMGIPKIDYTEPVRSFLDKGAKRHAFMTTGWAIFAFSVTMLLAYGASFYLYDVFRRYFGVTDSVPVVVGTLLFLAGVFAFGFWATRKNWEKDKKDIWLKVKRMMDELDREELNGKPLP